MRLAFVSAATAHHDGREGDRAWRIKRTAELLAERGHDVTVFCSQWWDGMPETFEHEGLTYRALTETPGARAFATRLPGALRRFDPDVVQAVHDRPAHVLAARAGSALAGASLAVDWYDVDPDPERSSLGGWLRRRAARAPARLFVPSRTVGTWVRELDAPDDAVEVVPNGVEFDLIRTAEPGDGGDVVYSRRLDDDANLESLLLALAEFRDRDWRATVIGDGPAREGYERQARDLRIADRVEFVGDLPIPERVRLFKDAHVYVHTARRTPFPTDLCRALACGCVGVVEYHVASSAHELVERRDRGFLATDDAELVESIAGAADLERRTVDDAFDEYDEKTVLRRYLDCYRELGAGAGLD